MFLSPPFADLTDRAADFAALVASLQQALPPASVLVLQVEDTFDVATLPDASRWDTAALRSQCAVILGAGVAAKANSAPEALRSAR